MIPSCTHKNVAEVMKLILKRQLQSCQVCKQLHHARDRLVDAGAVERLVHYDKFHWIFLRDRRT